ncbi:MAG: translation initiation factor IF-2, partial [Candidatus Gastranaerophilaceae bacterium]
SGMVDRKTKSDTEDKKPAAKENRPERNKKPIERHIIPQDIYENKGFSKKKADSKKKDKDFNSKKEEQERISLEKAAAQHHKKKVQKEEEVEKVTSIVVNKAMTISELADKIQKTPAEIVKFLMFQGVMATVNQLIDVDVIKKVCAEYELEVLDEDLDAYIEEELQKEEQKKTLTEVDKKLLKKRAPVVSIMGHVDHGKTTLLDSIRASKHKIVSTEVGGITQSIGAYTVYLDNNKEKKIVFVDTPGHEAFTEMRARGAKATDIAILVVAADDGIMPQTIEAINHAKAADVPIIVAVNKIDKPGADPDRVLQQLTEHGLVPEAWGGDTITVKVSALQGLGLDELLEYIWILADIKDLKANPKAEASGVVIEANLDKGKGPVATLLVQNGTLRAGNCIVVGTACGRIRALLSDSGERIQKAEPSTPVEILGLSEVPQAGEFFEVVKNDKEMKRIIAERQEKERDKRLDAMLPAHIRKEAVAGDDNIPQLNLIIKANTHGSAEAVAQAIAQLESKEITTKIIHVGVGEISEADVMLASASGAIILGFTVKEDSNALAAADREGVVIKKYDIIYQILEDIEKTMISLLSPEIKVVSVAKAEIRQVFTIGKMIKIAGCYVTEGKVNRNNTAIIKRNGKEIFKGNIDQLKRFKDDVKEVAQGFECGI